MHRPNQQSVAVEKPVAAAAVFPLEGSTHVLVIFILEYLFLSFFLFLLPFLSTTTKKHLASALELSLLLLRLLVFGSWRFRHHRNLIYPKAERLAYFTTFSSSFLFLSYSHTIMT